MGNKKHTKKRSYKNQKGGSGYETQEEHEQMINEQNNGNDNEFFLKKRNKENEKMKLEIHRLKIRKKDMRKECSDLVRLLQKKGVSSKVAKEYATNMFENKLYCDDGYIDSCNYCKDEYLKNLTTTKKKSMTPKVPPEALPKARSKSKSRSRKIPRRRKGPPERINMLTSAADRNRRLKDLKKELTKKVSLSKKSSIAPKTKTKSNNKNKLKKTVSIGGKGKRTRNRKKRRGNR